MHHKEYFVKRRKKNKRKRKKVTKIKKNLQQEHIDKKKVMLSCTPRRNKSIYLAKSVVMIVENVDL